MSEKEHFEKFIAEHPLYAELLEILCDSDEGEGGVGGLLGTVEGENGRYDVESVYYDPDFQYIEASCDEPAGIACHLDYPAFEVDVNFLDLSTDEQEQVLNHVKKTLNEIRC